MVSYLGEAVDCEYVWTEISPSVAILKTIGVYEDEVTGVDGRLAEPLYHYVDPEALDTLVKS